jgi:hypothetical protein
LRRNDFDGHYRRSAAAESQRLTLEATPNAAGFYLRHGFVAVRESCCRQSWRRRIYAAWRWRSGSLTATARRCATVKAAFQFATLLNKI